MQLPPISVLSTWPKPNYENPTTRGNELLILTIIFSPLALGMIILRTYTRLRISKAWGFDDILLFLSFPPILAIAIITVIAVRSLGWDRHAWDVKPEMLRDGLKLVIAMQCLFATAVSCYKISLLILTRRIMTSGIGLLKTVAEIGIGLVIAEWFVFLIVVVFTCRPVSAYWTLSTTPQTCINEKVHLLIAGIINTATDFLVFFLPIPTVLTLKIPVRQQVILTVVFGGGLVVCIAGTVRIYYTWKATTTFDRTWESYGVWISSMLELYIGIICASIPACKPFFSKYLPGLIGTSFGGQSRDVQELIITGYTKPPYPNDIARSRSNSSAAPSNRSLTSPLPQNRICELDMLEAGVLVPSTSSFILRDENICPDSSKEISTTIHSGSNDPNAERSWYKNDSHSSSKDTVHNKNQQQELRISKIPQSKFSSRDESAS